ncbi:MAG: hypothetical protein K2G55_06245 [Lachnospiraceae bacterium]|nr:hypothetical protein [Lachnospiraceae bacterium]MDE7203557.1 hypothetical protein [Lachnospiraceae bacterium]
MISNLISMFHDVRRRCREQRADEYTKELGCDYTQGYFYSTPVSKAEFIEYTKSVNGRK